MKGSLWLRPNADYADYADLSLTGTQESRNEPGFFVGGLTARGANLRIRRNRFSNLR